MPFRFNHKDLVVTASQSSNFFTKEGVLWFKEKEGKLFNKAENFSERFVRLRGNLLFYFKSREKTSECAGLIVLERCNIIEEKSNSLCAFAIEFEGTDEQRYEFVAPSKQELINWINALNSASYEKLHEKMLNLRKEILASTGQDPLPDYHPRLPGKSNDQTLNMNPVNDSTSDDVRIEICISCENLSVESDDPPSAMVRVFTMEPPSSEWLKHSNTEVNEDSREPNFLRTIVLSSKLSAVTRLKFVVYDVVNKAKNDVLPLGSAVCTIKDIQQAKNWQTTLSIRNMDNFVGNIHIQGWLRETATRLRERTMTNNLKDELRHYDPPRTYVANVLQRSFHFQTRDDEDVKFQEFLAETLLNFKIPKLLLSLFISEEKERVVELHNIGQLHPEWEKIKKNVQNNHFDLVHQYSTSLADLCLFEGSNFKRSVDKAKKELEFIPTNLHAHRLSVLESNKKEFFYDVITVGAPTAHSLKYKHGGLKKAIECCDETTRKVLEGVGPEERRKTGFIKATHVKEVLKRLKEELVDGIEKLRKVVENGESSLLAPASSKLSMKIGELLGLHSTAFVQESVEQLIKARTTGPELRIKSTIISSDIDDPSYKDLVWVWTGVEFKSVGKTKARNEEGGGLCDALACLMAEVNTACSGIFSEHQAEICHLLNAVDAAVTSLLRKINVTMRFILMQDEVECVNAKDICYRRDIVFSQTLTSVVSGFALMLSQRIDNVKFLEQISKIGLMVHFESLLTTYSDEMGMLEDMYVGVKDLCDVKFKVVCSDSPFPAVHGNRGSLTVDFPLKLKHFKLLPKTLKDGSKISLIPVLFSIGINESATLAEKFGDTSLQENINVENNTTVKTYKDALLNHFPGHLGSRCDAALSIDALACNLTTAVNTKKSKHYEVLLLSEELCYRLNALRITCCKSAKDRTAMSVTLEMVKHLEREHGMRDEVFTRVLNGVRSQGVRLINSYKNVGLPKYAFNKVQVKALPIVYRPPEGTIGKYLQT